MPTLSRSRSSGPPAGLVRPARRQRRSTSAPTATRLPPLPRAHGVSPRPPPRPRPTRRRVVARPRRVPRLVPEAQGRTAPTTGIATTSNPSPARSRRGLAISELKPFHVQQWLDANPGWKTGERGAVIAVQRAFNWAAKHGADRPPARSATSRSRRPGGATTSSRPSEFAAILGHVKDQEFRDLLDRLLGDRLPAAGGLAVEARHVDLAERRWVFPVEESKGKKQQRVVYLTERRPGDHPAAHGAHARAGRSSATPTACPGRSLAELPLRDGCGSPSGGTGCRARALCRRSSSGSRRRSGTDPAIRAAHTEAVLERRRQIAELARRHGPRYSLYTFRHSWCTHALERGLDAVTVAVLMGHRDTTMISRVYCHLMQRRDHLREAVRRAVANGGV